MSLSAFGSSSLGASPLGGSSLSITRVRLRSLNALEVLFDKAPVADDPGAFDSATNPDSWSLVALDPTLDGGGGNTQVPNGEVVPTFTPRLLSGERDDDNENLVRLFTDTSMEFLVRYELDLNILLKATDGSPIFGDTDFEVRAPDRGPPQVGRFERTEAFRDWDNTDAPGIGENREPGTFRFQSNTDIALQSEIASLRKRILRRITHRVGEFSFLRGYGLSVPLKKLIRPGEIQRFAIAVSAQVKLEPDVTDASATVSVQLRGNSVFTVTSVRVIRTNGGEVRFTYEKPLRS